MAQLRKYLSAIGLLLAAAGLAGCGPDKPQDYADRRPDPGTLSEDDTGLQSKDVLAASDQMAQDLLTDPQLNQSRTQWTMTIGHFEDQTTDREFDTNYDIFLERLRTQISQKGQGRVTLIENKSEFHAIRDSELEGGGDKYGQGPSGNSQPAPTAINPDYIMYGKAMDMPNRSTNFFILEFTIFNAQTRVQVWSRDYEVKVAR
jgi:Peptidoglycan-synthase activator LpoB